MPYKPELHDADSVMRYYDESDYSMYSVYAGAREEEKLRRFSYDGDDKIEGRENLQNSLNAILSNPDNTNTYMLALYNMKGKNKECKQTITFQLNRSNYIPANKMVDNYNPQLIQMIHQLESKLSAIEMRLQDEELDDELDEEQENNFLGTLMQNPNMQQMLMAGIMNILNPVNNNVKVTNMAGVEPTDDTQKLHHALEILSKHDDQLANDLYLLSQLAENDPMQFKFLLKMLRK